MPEDTPEAVPDEPVTRAPGSKARWGRDADGNEIQPPPGGLVFNPETGMAELPPPEKPAPEKPPAGSRQPKPAG